MDDRLMDDLAESCKTITRCQTQLDDWHGPAGKKLMNARSYLEKQLYPLQKALLDDPCAEGIAQAIEEAQ